ncbi:MAG: substrate-binding domain-containing protein [Thermosphaera sp.]
MSGEKTSRRTALKVAAGVIGGLVVGGVMGWLSKPVAEAVRTVTVTTTVAAETVTVTQPITIRETVTVTGTAIPPTEFKHGGTVTLIMGYLGEYWWYTCAKYFELAVSKIPDLHGRRWKFVLDTAEGSDTRQSEMIEIYALKSDLLVVNAVSIDGVNTAVRKAEETYHCPVIPVKDIISGRGRFQIEFSDFWASSSMVDDAVDWMRKKYGTAEGKILLAQNGDLSFRGWLYRYIGFRTCLEKYPEVDFKEFIGGVSPEGWADAADAFISTTTPDAIVSASDGPYLVGTLEALARYGKLYYVDNPEHIFVTSIDGKPSASMWVRKGYTDSVYPQCPDAIYFSTWEIARQYIIKDASYQQAPYSMPEIPLPLAWRQPKGTWWGGEDKYLIIDKVDWSETPSGQAPGYRVTPDNVNTWEMWGNLVTVLLGKEALQDKEFPAKGTPPPWSARLVEEYIRWWESVTGKDYRTAEIEKPPIPLEQLEWPPRWK